MSEPPYVGCYEAEEVATTVGIDADAVVNTTKPGMMLGAPAYMSPPANNLRTEIRKPQRTQGSQRKDLE